MKKSVIIKAVLALLVAVLLCPFVSTQAYAELSIKNGRVTGSTLDADWTLDVGDGYREWVRHITFNKPFLRTPRVSVSLAQVDNEPLFNLRVNVFARNVTRLGFDLVATTWSETRLYSVGASWIAHGQR
jgi:hypothetical protein